MRDLALMNAIRAALAGGYTAVVGALTNSGTEIQSSYVAPAALAAGETALLTPANASRHLRLTGTTSSFLCSLAAGSSKEIRTIENVGTVPITLGHEEVQTTAGVAVTATNRFVCPGLIPFILWPGDAVAVHYDDVLASARWRVLAARRPPSEVFLPPPEVFAAQTAFSLASGGLYRCDDSNTALRDAGALNADLTVVTGTPTYERWANGRWRGGRAPTNGDGWSSLTAFAPGTASFLALDLAIPRVNEGGARSFFGKATASGTGWFAQMIADGSVTFSAGDGVAHSGSIAIGNASALTIGSLVALGVQADRAAALARTRRDNVTAGTQEGTASMTLTGYLTLTAASQSYFAGINPGAINGCPADHLGLVHLVGAQIEGAFALGNLMHRLGCGQ